MKNIAFINCTNFKEYGFREIRDGKSSVEIALEYALSLEGVEKAVIISDRKKTEDFEKYRSSAEIVGVDNFTSSDLFNLFSREAESFEYIFYIYGDCPFLDRETAERMFKNHRKYFAQYSFADGNPYGTAPEIISSEIAGALKVLADKSPSKVERDSVFKTIQKDINSFDIETDISEKDMRLLRISLTADSRRNFLLLQRIASEGVSDEKEIVKLIEEKGEILRTLPAYYQIQISGKCFQKCMYCPYPGVRKDILTSGEFMDPDKISIIMNKIDKFSEDAVISLSLWGEASANPCLGEIIDTVMGHEKFSLLIETSGISLDRTLAASLADKYPGRITWIVSLDTDDRELYRNIRGEGYDEAVESAEFLLSVFPDNAFVQAVRMNETEDNLEHFFRYWKEKTENVIIQKYDNFSGYLEDRKVTDISPLKRFPCWHLKRDISVLVNGDVPFCREDVEGKIILGNIYEDTLEEIWEKGNKFYREQLNSEYSGICRECDEYYTYNF